MTDVAQTTNSSLSGANSRNRLLGARGGPRYATTSSQGRTIAANQPRTPFPDFPTINTQSVQLAGNVSSNDLAKHSYGTPQQLNATSPSDFSNIRNASGGGPFDVWGSGTGLTSPSSAPINARLQFGTMNSPAPPYMTYRDQPNQASSEQAASQYYTHGPKSVTSIDTHHLTNASAHSTGITIPSSGPRRSIDRRMDQNAGAVPLASNISPTGTHPSRPPTVAGSSQSTRLARNGSRRREFFRICEREGLGKTSDELCGETFTSQSEWNKHEKKHDKPFWCEEQFCKRTQGFTSTADLMRHLKTVHKKMGTTKSYRCYAGGCEQTNKIWPRKDNLMAHLKAKHGDIPKADYKELIKQWEVPSSLATSSDAPGPSSDQQVVEPPTQDLIRGMQGAENSQMNWPDPNSSPSSAFPYTPMQPNHSWEHGEILFPNPPYEPPQQGSVPNLDLPGPSTADIRGTLDQTQSGDCFPDESVVEIDRNTLDDTSPIQKVPEPTASLSNRPHDASSSAPQDRVDTTPDTDPGQDTEMTDEQMREMITGLDIEGFTEFLQQGFMPEAASDDLDSSHDHTDSDSQKPMDPGESPSSESSTSTEQLQRQPRRPTKPRANMKAQMSWNTLARVLKMCLGNKPQQGCEELSDSRSERSSKLLKCEQCPKKYSRVCELNKHQKRHLKPYGCTYPQCTWVFGSKSDWKRHESTQHYQLEMWRCEIADPDGNLCGEPVYTKADFVCHLETEHNLKDDPDRIERELVNRHIGRNGQKQFWCGFCREIIPLKNTEERAWNERADHIDNHVARYKSMDRWYCMVDQKTKGQMKSERKAKPETSPSPEDRTGGGGDAAYESDYTLDSKDKSASRANLSSYSWTKKPSRRSTPAAPASASASVSFPPLPATLSRIPRPSHKRAADDDHDHNDQASADIALSPSDGIVTYCCRCNSGPFAAEDLRANDGQCECRHRFCHNCARKRTGNARRRSCG